MFFIRLCLSVVRDERPASSAGLLEKFFVLAALLPASFFFRTPSAETLCVFTECWALRCFCFLSTNAVQMTPDDPDNTRSACLSSYSTSFQFDKFVLSDTSGPPTARDKFNQAIANYWGVINFFKAFFCTFHFG